MPPHPDTQIIKQSIALRAKWRANPEISGPTFKTLSPAMVVPHPQNRYVSTLRTKQLVGSIVKDACDVDEANSSAVAVEENPNLTPDSEKTLQMQFQARSRDVDMATFIDRYYAAGGSLSHGHFNCGMRNIICSKAGCECPTLHGDGEKQCKCPAQSILNSAGTYSLGKLQRRDRAWHDLCLTGLTWEMLSFKMDLLEPDAALVIAIALNKKNALAMKTGALEIWNTLVKLCNPDPTSGLTPYEPIRDRMIELYGADADTPAFLQMFRLILDFGGADSPHLRDLGEFTAVLVNPKLRKLPSHPVTPRSRSRP